MTETPLHRDDPARLGGYRLLSRLGEGGMGTVYLAEDSAGHRVALKVVRPELTSNPEFRSRFRSEVTRAHAVPPFCTAEILDADPDHEPPYLVAEFVDGPSLADVVAEGGPLAGGPLHSLAIGVATALAAIHGAGVIHRDLKPANVLFALGTPKLIDFGIAKAVEDTSEHTASGHLLGTVAYMAPERFDPDQARRVGPAADIFAWAVLVAFAATGRTPFAADSPLSTASRILTESPDLTGLTGHLRELVDRALNKDPRRRPTAHELVYLLLAAGRHGNLDVGAELATKPAVRDAAEAPRHKASYRGRHSVRTETSAHDLPTTVADPVRRARTAPSRGTLRAATVLSIVAALVAAATIVVPDSQSGDNRNNKAAEERAEAALIDSFDRASNWRTSRSDTRSRCAVDNTLVAARRPAATVRCAGPSQIFADQTIDVDVRVHTPHVCAAVWAHFIVDTGYRISICPLHVNIDLDIAGEAQPVASARLERLPLKRWRHLQIRLDRAAVGVVLDGVQKIATAPPADAPGSGRVMLGLTPEGAATHADAAGEVAYANLEVRLA